MANKDIAKIGKRFSKDYQPKNNGRPVNRFKHLHGQYECSADDVDAVIKELLNADKSELMQIIKDPDTATLRYAIASALINDTKKGALTAIQFLLERQFGKAKQTVDNNVNINNPPTFKVVFEQENIDHSAYSSSGNQITPEVSTPTKSE